MPSILLVVKHAELDQHNARMLARIAHETATENPQASRGATAGGDSRKLRGIPAIGPTVQGAIPGTNPLQALLLSDHPDI